MAGLRAILCGCLDKSSKVKYVDKRTWAISTLIKLVSSENRAQRDDKAVCPD